MSKKKNARKKNSQRKPKIIKKLEKKKNKKKNRKKRWKKILSWFIYLSLIGFLICSIAFIIFVAHVSKDLPTTDGLINRIVPETTQIYDSTGETVLYELHGDEKRTIIEIEDLPDYVYNAVVAIEDRDFYEHKGIVPKRIVKAIYVDSLNIACKIFKGETCRNWEGASTITQQLVKNAILTNEFSVTRKLREMILAWQLDKRFDKQQVLKMYLNEIPLGSVNYGYEAACQNYFGKSAKDLSIAEAAVMAAMIQMPSYYSPYGSHVDDLLERQQFVINLMEEQGYITEEEANTAREEEIVFAPAVTNIEAPHFVMYAINYVQEMLGEDYSEQLLQEGGLKIYTTINLDTQKIAEETISNQIENIEAHGGDNTSLVAINPKNGHILAMVGSRDYFDEEHNGQFNVALASRQPGSSIKPLAYLAAFAKGYYPETILYDVVTNFSVSGNYTPKNYDFKERGPISMRKALQGSLNIPAVKTLYLAGLDNVIELAKKLGYSTVNDPDRFGLSFVLGGAEVKLLEHTAAFGALANDGVFNKAIPITKIINRNGEIIKEIKPTPKDVVEKDAVRMLNNVLSDDLARHYAFGPNSNLQLGTRPVAAKTGTTNDYKDAWTVGYTPSLVAGVWAGNNDNTSMNNAGGITVAAPIWNEFMTNALKDTEIEFFPAPPHNNSSKPVLNGSIKNGKTIKIDSVSGKLATENTPEEFVEEKKFMEVHSILYYCDKNNPNGPRPTNPAQDPQFNNWENAVQTWLQKYNAKAEENPDDDIEPIDTSAPPTEYDDVHTDENKPQLTISNPTPNEIITSNKLHISVNASSPQGIERYEYFLDNQIIPSSNNNYVEYSLYNTEIGEHTVRVKVSDKYGNFKEKEVTFILEENDFPVEMSILYPQNNNSYSITSFPLVFTLNILGANKINNLQFCYKPLNTSTTADCISVNNYLLDGNNTFRWETPPENTGEYSYYFNATTNNGDVQTNPQIINLR